MLTMSLKNAILELKHVVIKMSEEKCYCKEPEYVPDLDIEAGTICHPCFKKGLAEHLKSDPYYQEHKRVQGLNARALIEYIDGNHPKLKKLRYISAYMYECYTPINPEHPFMKLNWRKQKKYIKWDNFKLEEARSWIQQDIEIFNL